MQLGPTLERLDRLRGADIVLPPYSPTFYGHGSSGVLTESASLGKMLVVSPGTMPARQGRKYRLSLAIAVKWTPQAMADCAAAFWDRLLATVRPPPFPAPTLALQA